MSAYTLRSVGSWSTTGSPGDPAGKTAGDLLLMFASARLSTETLNAAPAGWTLLLDTSTATKEQLALFGRIATGDANDSVSAHDFWSGTSYNLSQIAAFSGDVWAGGLGSIIAHSVVAGSDNNTANLPHSALTISTAGCLVLVLGTKQKTVASDGASLTDPAWIGSRLGFRNDNGSTAFSVWGYVQQTTAANISAGSWAQSIAESLHYASMVVALKTAPTTTKYLKALAHPSAAGATGVEAVVHSAPGGANYITGTTRYGSTNGLSFEATTEGAGVDERAVLKILADDVGCSGLAVDTVVAVCARNATLATEVIPGIIIEE